ncbi:hypothetical protein ES705_30972 [subsurface metagenome]
MLTTGLLDESYAAVGVFLQPLTINMSVNRKSQPFIFAKYIANERYRK